MNATEYTLGIRRIYPIKLLTVFIIGNKISSLRIKNCVSARIHG